MITASRLAGFIAAHAIWSVSSGDTLTPMLAYTTEDDERKMSRFASDDLETAVKQGQAALESSEENATDAVLVYDGRITIEGAKFDAIIIEMKSWFSPDSSAVLATPYTRNENGGFRVHKPKLLEWTNCEDFDMNFAFQSFFEGVEEHEEGSKIWSDSLDESK